MVRRFTVLHHPTPLCLPPSPFLPPPFSLCNANPAIDSGFNAEHLEDLWCRGFVFFVYLCVSFDLWRCCTSHNHRRVGNCVELCCCFALRSRCSLRTLKLRSLFPPFDYSAIARSWVFFLYEYWDPNWSLEYAKNASHCYCHETIGWSGLVPRSQPCI